MKKSLSIILCLLVIISIPISAQAAMTFAVKSNQQIYIDGQAVELTAYNIGGSNYVRLRDLAETMEFDIYYDGADGSVHVSTSLPYSGGASAMGETPKSVEVMERQPTIYVNGTAFMMTAYNIGGNYYIKLREVGAAVNFSVEWDSVNYCVLIDASKPYSETSQGTLPPATQSSATDIPDGEEIDYSLEANPEIFDNFYSRETYNTERKNYLDTGTTVNWGTNRIPQSTEAIDVLDKLLDSLSQLTELEKVYKINEFLSSHITYNAAVAFVGDDFWMGIAYGVCEDYARMFQYICHKAGVPCVYVRGERLPASPTGRHAWNEVYIEGKWQFYDGTLSDSRKTIVMSDTAESANT